TLPLPPPASGRGCVKALPCSHGWEGFRGRPPPRPSPIFDGGGRRMVHHPRRVFDAPRPLPGGARCRGVETLPPPPPASGRGCVKALPCSSHGWEGFRGRPPPRPSPIFDGGGRRMAHHPRRVFDAP